MVGSKNFSWLNGCFSLILDFYQGQFQNKMVKSNTFI